MLKRYLVCQASRAIQVAVLLLACGNVSADCIGEQLACTNRCIAVNVRDTACTTRCGQRAEACLRREEEREKPDSDGDSSSIDTEDDDAPQPAPARTPSGPTQFRPQSAQYDSSDASTCYEPFYDPNSYSWLAIRNKCSTAIHVTWKCQACPERLGSSADIPPGRSVGAGLSRDEVARRGGMSYAACREGYRAVGDDGESWRGGSLFRCRKR
jgi:hypothetical protein